MDWWEAATPLKAQIFAAYAFDSDNVGDVDREKAQWPLPPPYGHDHEQWRNTSANNPRGKFSEPQNFIFNGILRLMYFSFQSPRNMLNRYIQKNSLGYIYMKCLRSEIPRKIICKGGIMRGYSYDLADDSK